MFLFKKKEIKIEKNKKYNIRIKYCKCQCLGIKEVSEMSQFKKYLGIVTEGKDYVYNEENYDLYQWPQVIQDSRLDMLTMNLTNLKDTLEVNLDNMNGVADIKLIGYITRTLRNRRNEFDKKQKELHKEIRKLLMKYEDYYGKS